MFFRFITTILPKLFLLGFLLTGVEFFTPMSELRWYGMGGRYLLSFIGVMGTLITIRVWFDREFTCPLCGGRGPIRWVLHRLRPVQAALDCERCGVVRPVNELIRFGVTTEPIEEPSLVPVPPNYLWLHRLTVRLLFITVVLSFSALPVYVWKLAGFEIVLLLILFTSFLLSIVYVLKLGKVRLNGVDMCRENYPIRIYLVEIVFLSGLILFSVAVMFVEH
ncbi:MAG: hypothetical protein KDA65_16360 [Planctomycetaceae bacterium]|nr:hypothetical protein [Planctomycetaceae bacterium]